MIEKNYLEKVKLEQEERRIEFAKNFFKFPVAVFVSKTEEIKWYDKYIKFLEKDFNE
jgi:hypothetical protein